MKPSDATHFVRRRSLLAGALASTFGGTVFRAHAQQTWPTKPVRLIVPTAAGSGSDLVARALAQKLSGMWNAAVIVDNRAGASGIIGVQAAARAPADGYTLLLSSTSPITINPLIFKKLPYDPQRDLVPVSHVAIGPAALLINASTPAQTLGEFIALAKSKPKQMSYGSFGTGSGGHLGVEAFCQAAGIELIHVPYKGTAPAVTDLLAGQITAVLTDLATAQEHITTGRLRALAINGPDRSPLLPSVPTFTEQGYPSVEATYARFGLFAPAGTPQEIVENVSASAVAALKAPDVRDRFVQLGYVMQGSTPQAFAAILRQDTQRWARVVSGLGGITLD